MGAVYLAFDLEAGLPVALKENLMPGFAYARGFQREAVLLGSLRHPNIPRGIDHFIVEGTGQYLVMDFVEGETSDEWTASHSPSPLELLSVLSGVFDALAYVHSRKPPVIHRDVEPTNIIVNDRRIAFLVDFGVAKLLGPRPETLLQRGARANHLPEGHTDERSDEFSLAATLYALMTHQLPADSLQRALGEQVLQPPRSLNPAIPPRVEEALIRALSIKAEDRYRSIDDFRRALTAGM
jgi:serine/threonine protein kinase